MDSSPGSQTREAVVRRLMALWVDFAADGQFVGHGSIRSLDAYHLSTCRLTVDAADDLRAVRIAGALGLRLSEKHGTTATTSGYRQADTDARFREAESSSGVSGRLVNVNVVETRILPSSRR